MFVATLVVSVLLAAVFAASGAVKVAGARRARDMAAHLGLAWPRYRSIGFVELACAAGLLVGLAVVGVGVAAALVLILLMAGAVVAHARAGDTGGETIPAASLAMAAGLAVLLRMFS